MKKPMFFQLLFCIMIVGCFLYAYIRKQNHITELRLCIPYEAEKLQNIRDQNVQLQFDVDQFENPVHLMQLAELPEFGHLKNPTSDRIITVQVFPEAI